MMKSTLITLSALALLFGTMLSSCNNVAPDKYMENPVTFDTIVISEQYHFLGDSANPFCSLVSSFIYPSDYADSVILQKMKQHFLTSFFGEDIVALDPNIAMSSYAKKYIAGYKELEQELVALFSENDKNPSQEALFTYYEISSNEILYNKCGLLSYRVFVEFYTGDAQGKHAYNNHTLYLQTGEALKEQDIFIEGYQDELSEIIVHAIAKDMDACNLEELENRGYFNVKEIYPNNNFYVDEEGITYTYNEYEIAAYNIGKTDAKLPFDEIRHLIREDSPIAPLIFTKK